MPKCKLCSNNCKDSDLCKSCLKNKPDVVMYLNDDEPFAVQNKKI